jgi:hypothetical protein
MPPDSSYLPSLGKGVTLVGALAFLILPNIGNAQITKKAAGVGLEGSWSGGDFDLEQVTN